MCGSRLKNEALFDPQVTKEATCQRVSGSVTSLGLEGTSIGSTLALVGLLWKEV